ncbi:MAG: glycosyltransferase family 4 protein [Prevotella pectinovora]|nr:glycosyltransferase family 4 protein [Prevotella pectinovora]
MKITYIVEDFSENGGVERIVTEKANTLATEYGHEVSVVSVYDDKRRELYHLDESIKMVHLGVPFADKHHGKLIKLISRTNTLMTAARRLNKTIKSLQPDIIFFTTTLGALLLPLCHTKARKIYESHLARPFTPYHRMFSIMERKADTVVCLTNGDAMEYSNARRTLVIPNFIKKPTKRVEDYSVKRAIAVGRLEEQKGFLPLIDHWKDIARLHPDWHLDIYGDGSQRDMLQAEIERLGMQEHITLCGRSNNIMDVYPQYSLHIMPSLYEGQPMALIEAQSCGLPSVVFDFDFGASDIVRNGYNGIIVEQSHYSSLIKGITTMMDSEALRRQYGDNAIAGSHAYYKENVFGKWIQLLNPDR